MVGSNRECGCIHGVSRTTTSPNGPAIVRAAWVRIVLGAWCKLSDGRVKNELSSGVPNAVSAAVSDTGVGDGGAVSKSESVFNVSDHRLVMSSL